MAHSTTLAYPDQSRPFHVHTDAGDVAVGATLSQEDDNGEIRLVACMSKQLCAAVCNYPAHERELLALVRALTYWPAYLWDARIKAYTDNTFVKYLRTCELNSPRHVRWVSLIESYNVEFTHIPGTTNTAADALSRLDHSLMPRQLADPKEDWTSDYQQQVQPIAGKEPWKVQHPQTRRSTMVSTGMMTGSWCQIPG